jgi:hypothetical protein
MMGYVYVSQHYSTDCHAAEDFAVIVISGEAAWLASMCEWAVG